MTGDNRDQRTFWSGPAGDNWVAHQRAMDTLLTPVLDLVLARADLAPGQRVLDVGCGTGQSTIAAGDLVGAGGAAVGADISAPMLARARRRAEGMAHVSFVEADVASHRFERPFDRLVSRFGVMFFDDTAAGFASLAAAMAPGGRMAVATWGAIEANPFFTLPARTARDQLGAPPRSDPDAPGPFALRDIPKVEAILRAAGWRAVEGRAHTLHLALPEGARALARLCTRIGPAHGTLVHFDADEAARQRLEDTLTDAIAALPDHAFPAEINVFTATAP